MTCRPKHADPVHFNRGRHGHAWICISCGVQLSGPKLPDDEREILIAFAKAMRGNGKNLKTKAQPGTTGESQMEYQMTENTMQISVTMPMHASNEDIAAALRHRAGLFEGMTAKEAGSRANTDAPKTTPMKKKAAPPVEEEETTDVDSDDEDFAPKKKPAAKKAAASFDEDDGGDDTATTDEDEDFEAKPAKKTAAKKAPKITHDDVVDACKEAARENGRPAVVAILKKKFKVDSVSDLKQEQYAAVIEAVTSI